MYKELVRLILIIFVLSLAGNVSAADISWDDGATDSLLSMTNIRNF